jgi:hypothetical protein
MSIRRILAASAVVLFAGTALAGCGDDDGNDTAGPEGESGATTLTVVATDFSFDQTKLSANGREAVTFVLKNEGAVEHNLTIEDLDVDEDAEPG